MGLSVFSILSVSPELSSTLALTTTVPVSLLKLTLFFLKIGSVLFGSGYVLLRFSELIWWTVGTGSPTNNFSMQLL